MQDAVVVSRNSNFSHGRTRRSTDEFNKLTIKQKNKYPSVKILDNPCKSVAKNQNEEFFCLKKIYF